MTSQNTLHPRRPTRRKRRSGLIITLFILALLSAGGWYGWQQHSKQSDDSTRLQFVEVKRSTIEDLVTATGSLQPRDHVDVGAQVSGLLTRIHVEVGQQVSPGDLLAEIDPTVLQTRVDATRAQLRNQRAQLMDREASLQLAEIQLRRQRNLMADQATSEEAVQTAEANLRSARAQIEALTAQIEQTESNLRADAANLEYTRIYAPMAGTVVSIAARQGQTLNANQQAPTILRIADLGTMTVHTQVSEADVSRLKSGIEVYFTTLGSAGQRWYGRLRTVEPTPTVTNNVVLYNALFEVPNADQRLMTQMTAQVFFVIAKAEDALTVPMSALSGLSTSRTSATNPTRPFAGMNRGEASDPAEAGNNRPTGERSEASRHSRHADRTPNLNADDATFSSRRGAPERSATVQLRLADGRIEPREVRIGVSSRVAAQVLSGLEEGDSVVAGQRTASASVQSAAGTPRMPR